MDITAVNSLHYEDFVSVFGNVVEKCPIVAAAVCSQRPFNSLNSLEAAISEFIDALPQSGEIIFFLYQIVPIVNFTLGSTSVHQSDVYFFFLCQ